MGSAEAVAATLSRMFESSAIEDDPRTKFIPPFEPVEELPKIFQDAINLHQSRRRNEEGMFEEIQREYRGIAGAVIIRDSEDSGRTSSLMSDNLWLE